MKYDDFDTLFYNICEIKESMVKLKSSELRNIRKQFFELDFPEWRLQLLWEFIWDDKSYDEIYHIFSEKKIIKKVGENYEKKQH